MAKLPSEPIPKEIDFLYIKTASYRTYHVDGIIGAPTPAGKFYIELFVERQVTPQVIRQKVTPEGALGDEVSREGKTGIVREVEAGIIMDENAALIFKEWLEKNIKAFQEWKEQRKKHESPPDATK
jgi:hypothetical protein